MDFILGEHFLRRQNLSLLPILAQTYSVSGFGKNHTPRKFLVPKHENLALTR